MKMNLKKILKKLLLWMKKNFKKRNKLPKKNYLKRESNVSKNSMRNLARLLKWVFWMIKPIVKN